MSKDVFVSGIKKKGSVVIFTFQRIKECEAFIIAHHGKMTQPEMAGQLKVGTTTITRLVNKLGLKKRHYKKRYPKAIFDRKSGMFNVNRHPDWLVG